MSPRFRRGRKEKARIYHVEGGSSVVKEGCARGGDAECVMPAVDNLTKVAFTKARPRLSRGGRTLVLQGCRKSR